MRRLAFSLFCVTWCAACATRGANAPKVVQTSTPPVGCTPLGQVTGSDESMDVNKPWEHLQLGPSKAAAITQALDEAAAKGATHATLGKPKRLDRGFSVEGMAYDCSSRPPASPAEPVAAPAASRESEPPPGLGCFKDTDCKGDRICRNRVCVDP